MPSLELIRRAQDHAGRTALVASEGAFTYRDLLEAAARVAGALRGGSGDLRGARIAYLVPSGFKHVAIQWGIAWAGGVAVPLCEQHPKPEWLYAAGLVRASIVISHPATEAVLREVAQEIGASFLSTDQALSGHPVTQSTSGSGDPAMILFTSGTTGKPKGVVHTHRSVAAQIETMIDAWGWSADDRIVHVLPLHHTHGLINVLSCALWTGATCEMLPKFDAGKLWDRLSSGEVTVFMAVPTIYARLIKAWEEAPPERREAWSAGARNLRLMVSGSAALPESVLERWRALTGHTLLERYGMTEIGMALSNPLHGERRPGHVGAPMPGVEVRLIDEQNQPIDEDEKPGEIQVRGPNLFKEYWENAEATRAAFAEGWFKTGDIAVRDRSSFRILGRNSVDIIKTGGYKVSALEIESALLQHPAIAECAVVGVPDPEWGERVGAAAVLRAGAALDLDALRGWAKERLAAYKVPSRLLLAAELPRNAMGKLTKPEIVKLFK